MCSVSNPSSVRFDDHVLRRLGAWVASHPGMSLSGAGNRLVGDALRSHEHPLVVFRDGLAGRRARLIGGPDVWEVVRAVRSARGAEPDLSSDEIVALVADTSGVTVSLVRAAVAYWADFPEEVDDMITRADDEDTEARQRWEREHQLLGE